MITLVEFLEARLGEDEATALAAHARGRWSVSSEGGIYESEGGCIATGPYGCGIGDEADHIARHDPARVLREVAAKRRLLLLRSNAAGAVAGVWEGTPQRNRVVDHAYLEAITDVLEELATAWADHPDYRSEWSPS